MTIRKAISKKLRFDIFIRDSFKCQYCGNSTPNVILEIDHIIPISKGGDNSFDNLLTSCFDCNRGKSNNVLFEFPFYPKHKILLDNKRLNDEKNYFELIKEIDSFTMNKVNSLDVTFERNFSGYFFKDNYRYIIGNLIEDIGYFKCEEALFKSISKIKNPDYCLDYFVNLLSKIKKQNTYGKQ